MRKPFYHSLLPMAVVMVVSTVVGLATGVVPIAGALLGTSVTFLVLAARSYLRDRYRRMESER